MFHGPFSVIRTFQLSKHPLVPCWLDKWLPTVHLKWRCHLRSWYTFSKDVQDGEVTLINQYTYNVHSLVPSLTFPISVQHWKAGWQGLGTRLMSMYIQSTYKVMYLQFYLSPRWSCPLGHLVNYHLACSTPQYSRTLHQRTLPVPNKREHVCIRSICTLVAVSNWFVCAHWYLVDWWV